MTQDASNLSGGTSELANGPQEACGGTISQDLTHLFNEMAFHPFEQDMHDNAPEDVRAQTMSMRGSPGKGTASSQTEGDIFSSQIGLTYLFNEMAFHPLERDMHDNIPEDVRAQTILKEPPGKEAASPQAEKHIFDNQMDLTYLFDEIAFHPLEQDMTDKVPEDVRTQTMSMRGPPDKGTVNTQAEGEASHPLEQDMHDDVPEENMSSTVLSSPCTLTQSKHQVS